MPSAKAASISAGATATAFRYPETSVNHSRTKRMSRSSSVRRTNSCCRSMFGMIQSARFRDVTSPQPCPLRANGTRAPRRSRGDEVLERDVGVGESLDRHLLAGADQLLDRL